MAWTITHGFFLLDGKIIGEFNKPDAAADYPTHPIYSVAFADWIPAARLTHGADDYVVMASQERNALRGHGFTRTDMRRNADDTDYIVHSIDAFDTIAPDKRDDLRHALTKHHSSDVRSDLNAYTALYCAYRAANREHTRAVDALARLTPDNIDYAEALRNEADVKADRNQIQERLDEHEPHWLKVLIGEAVITGYGHGNYTITGENIDAFAESLATLASADIESDRASKRLTRPDPVFRHNLGELIAENIRKDEKITDDSIRTIPKNLEVADLAATYALLKTASSG